MELIDLQGTVAIVTGAARGIGWSIAQRLGEFGSAVVAVDIDIDIDIDDGVAAQPGCRSVVGDVALAEVQQRCLDTALSMGGDLAILVNAAFVEERAHLLDGTRAGWDRTIEVSLRAPVELSRRFVAALDGRPGSIVNVASVHAFGGVAGFGAYAAAKSGLVSFTRTAAVEWGPLGVRVNAVAPGFIAVERNAPIWSDPASLAAAVSHHPLGRAGQPKEVADCVAFLAGRSSSFVTGAVLPVDGGALARLPQGDRP